MKNFIYKYILKRIIRKSCPARIPRSGKRGEGVNCYVVAIDREDAPYFIATEISGDNLEGLLWNGSAYADSARISINNLDGGKINITHYYGLSEIVYSNIYDLAWNYFTGFVYLKIKIRRNFDNTYQYFFNKKKLVTKRRMELLRFMMDDQLDREYDGILSIHLMEKLYSMHMFLHPSWELQHRKVELYLQSLVLTGELNFVGNEYVVTGRAIGTIERYEEEERRHVEAVKLQRRMFWLTFVAVVFAVVQSGVIKLPTIFDFS